MAELLWGQVYFHDLYAGVLRQEPGERYTFTYDPSYLSPPHPPIAWTLPLQFEPHLSPIGLHPFFDNLVAEGWLEEAQTRLLGKRQASRFELLLAFGQDCAGAISVRDPTLVSLHQNQMDLTDPRQLALLAGRASLSGIQPKLTLIKKKGTFHPARSGETSTHIAKFPSPRHADLIMNEFLTMRAFQALLPDDPVVDLHIAQIEGFPDPALVIKRFDRTPDGRRIHFEEFNQLLNRKSHAKYEGSHKEMADFLRQTPGSMPTDIYRLFRRILAGLLLGNTDMHLKNFALIHTPEGLRLSPSYDQVAAALYGYKTVALVLAGVRDMSWSRLKAGALLRLGDEFGLPTSVMKMAYELLAAQREAALESIAEAPFASQTLKHTLLDLVKKRWNGTFNLIGPALSRRP